MMNDPVVRLSGHVAEVTRKTRWIFVEVETAAGLTGVGEASLNSQDRAVLEATEALSEALFALPHAAPGPWPLPMDLAAAAAVSAIDHALWDIAGRRAGRSVAAMLGGPRRVTVPLYANINRRTLDRRPEGFGESARAALAAGFTAVKIAPFDEVMPGMPVAVGAIGLGLDRIAAARAAIGPGCDLLVDCHWRLTEPAAVEVIRAAAAAAVYWVECPLPETDDTLAALRRLRGLANARGMRLAGCELGIGAAGFAPFLRAGAYDVMMPDVKYVGGLAEMLRLSDNFAQAKIGFSPHNPTGPIGHAVSLHVCAAAPSLDRLEVQFDETDLFGALAGNALPPPHGGISALPADAAGLGVALAPDVLRRQEVMGFVRHRREPPSAGTAIYTK